MSEYPEAPVRAQEIWDWIAAFDAFDYGDRGPLSTLLMHASEIPKEAAIPLANIVSGKRKPNLKAGAKLKIPAKERMELAANISMVIYLSNEIRTRGIAMGEGYQGQSAVEKAADVEGKEVIAIVNELHGEVNEIIRGAAEEYCVSTETIENLMRDMRKKIDAFPEI